ncbi:MAG TPA: glutathione binding-like protein [Gammaproteobacteria bacterium]
MYQLYLGRSTAGFAPHVLLREIGADFTLHFLDTAAGEHKRANYLAINPFGKVPALVVDGHVMAESAAICLWLADHPDAALAPLPSAPERMPYLKWMLFLASTLHGALMPYFYPQRYTTGTEGHDAVKQAAVIAATGWFAQLEQHLAAHGPYLLGEKLSAADFYLFMLVRWGRHFDHPPRNMPAIAAFMQRLFGRASVQEAFAAEGITERFF